jgi:hypothetical protein
MTRARLANKKVLEFLSPTFMKPTIKPMIIRAEKKRLPAYSKID